MTPRPSTPSHSTLMDGHTLRDHRQMDHFRHPRQAGNAAGLWLHPPGSVAQAVVVVVVGGGGGGGGGDGGGGGASH